MNDSTPTVGYHARIGNAGAAVLHSTTREPFTERVPDIGTEVLVHTGFGYVLAKLTQVDGPKAQAETPDSIYPLDYWLDERRCWSCSTGLSKRALETVQF